MKNDVVSSCRVRLARNIDGVPFGKKIDQGQIDSIIATAYGMLSNSNLGQFLLHRIKDMDLLDAKVMQEKRLISDDLIQNSENGAAIIDEFEQVSLMLMEEDHFRLQCIMDGLNLYEAYERLIPIDDILSQEFGYAYDLQLGHLTSCITNVGTGVRAGALLFLPGLTITQEIEKNINIASNFKIAIRGYYGEGSGNEGFFYQISNQCTLGLSEQEILQSVTNTINHLTQAELSARQTLLKNDGVSLRDKIGRAYGVLTNAYTLTSKEFMSLIALVKLGASLDLIKFKDQAKIDKLILDCQPAKIISLCGEKDVKERDIYRARLTAKTLKI
ncbi:MAG: ATP--guanido phosphotransferase [Firmicutes bacterium]|nr:ATP--guanido phosphotransferase [Bacillota bacterium]MCL1953608.1 ATP--guanido phosphotransferase [Bacillota bacterium]